jgi:hypothetical protein
MKGGIVFIVTMLVTMLGLTFMGVNETTAGAVAMIAAIIAAMRFGQQKGE